jgi:hypothetical protein
MDALTSMRLLLAGDDAETVAALRAWLALAGASVAATREVSQNANFDQRNFLGGKHEWVDELVNDPVAYLYAGEFYWNGVWQQLFWNHSIRRVYVLPGVSLQPGLPKTTVALRPDGTLLGADGEPVPERYVVASNVITMSGSALGGIEQRELPEHGLTLWRSSSAVRLLSMSRGVRENGDIHGPAQLLVYGCSGGRLELTLLPKLSTFVDLRVNGKTVRTLRFHGEPFVNTTIFAPPGAQLCKFEVSPDSLLGSTRFEFVRS